MMAYGGGAAAAAHAAIVQAIKASGAIVRVEPEEFRKILARAGKTLVVTSRGGFLRPGYRYLTSYRGLAFYTRSAEEIMLSGDCEVIAARDIWIPG